MGEAQRQLFRFISIGAAATSVHVGTAIILVEFAKLHYLWANFYAFSAALSLSFFGHYHWTFSANTGYAYSLPRFVITAIAGLIANQAIMFSAVNIFKLDYKIGLIAVVLIVPLAVFLLSKSWAFNAVKN